MNKNNLQKTQRACLGAMLALSLASASCHTSSPDPGGGDPDKPRAGYVTGKAVDSQGKPLSGVEVVIDNTLFYNTNLLTNTDANGLYRVQTPNGSWRATAQVRRTYNGKSYRLDLAPNTADAFTGDEGAVRHFEWRLSGEKSDNPGAFYGGSVEVSNEVGKGPYDAENVEFTFTPVGPLIDGSAGKTLVLSYDTYYGRIPDVPIGRYRITAVYKPTDTRLQLRNRVNGTYAADGAVTMDFFGEIPYWSCTNCMFLEYSEP
ncbi:carboxypeptidase-like regulatory domain-containing protein [Persicitalea jodogahamensis]|uniref:Carboxypeptidase regulatory-like domain-containing protein n=1 Tax=Persicitalea jodogahamensis TaxID=402147 RepID=A0A8J3DA77_9BACT|nr:carboxypeptidase-like regulatory domain-containing protein [Persicitalea jodogahamensis]GHB75428.1 hypothetical protein GCM10007390_31460 [Persicitalea jodogahamensis]